MKKRNLIHAGGVNIPPFRAELLIFVCSFFFSLGGNILNFSLVYLLVDRFSFTPGQIGAYIALGQAFYFTGCNLYHRFGSAFNPLSIFPVSAFVVFLASIPLGYIPVRFAVYASYWVLQLATGLFWPPVMAWLTGGLPTGELNRKVSLFNRSWMAANILGPLVAGPVYQWNKGVNFLFINISFCAAFALLFVMKRSLANSSEKEAVSSGAGKSAPDRESAAELHGLDKRLDLYRYRGWINSFSVTLLVGILANVIPLHIRDGLGFTERSAGIVLFMRCALSFCGFTLLARFTFWHFKRGWFILMQAGIMLSVLIFLPAGNRLFLYYTAAAISGLIHSGSYTNSIFYSGATGRFPKKNLALHEICISVGNAAGSAGGGFLYQRFGFEGVCLALIAVLCAGMGALFFLDRREFPAARPGT